MFADPSTDGKDPSEGLASCSIFNSEIILELKCSPKANSTERSRKKSASMKEQRLRAKPKVYANKETRPPKNHNGMEGMTRTIKSESRNEVTKKSSAHDPRKERGSPTVDLQQRNIPKSVNNTASKITLKPLKPASLSADKTTSGVDVNEMARLYDKYLATKNGHANSSHDVVSTPPVEKANKATFFRVRLKKTNTKKECLNENILTEGADNKAPPAPVLTNSTVKKTPFRFFQKKSERKLAHPENIVIVETESAHQLEKNDSSASEPTFASAEGSNSIVETVSALDEANTATKNGLDTISVFETFEQYTVDAFPASNCSPRFPTKKFEINNQAELLTRIEKLQKELSETKDTVKDLTEELDEVYSEKDVAVHKLDMLIQAAKMSDNEEHDKLREIRMYLTDRTEPTISSITTGGNDHHPPEAYHPFCLCLRPRM